MAQSQARSTRKVVHCPPCDEGTAQLDRHQQIRDVALLLFANEGYANVSLRHIGDRIGLHAGSLYAHMDSKQSLLFELIQEHLEDLLATVRQRVNGQRSVTGKVAAFVRTHIQFQVDQQPCALLTSLELRNLEERNQSEIKRLLNEYRDCFGAIFDSGVAQGHFSPQSRTSAIRAVLGMLSTMALWFREGGEQSQEQLTDQLTRMVLGALSSPSLMHL